MKRIKLNNKSHTEDRSRVKLHIGDPIYLLYKNKSIICDFVKFLGTESFILDHSFQPEFQFDSYEWFYKDKDIKWSTNLDKMLEILQNVNPGKNIEHVIGQGWEEYSIMEG